MPGKVNATPPVLSGEISALRLKLRRIALFAVAL